LQDRDVGRLDRERLGAPGFGIAAEIPVRYDDIDGQGHVNNAAAAVILQEARTHFHAAARDTKMPAGLLSMVASLSIEFVGEMFFPGFVEVRTGVLRVGRTSYVLGQVGRQGGRITLYGETVLVVADADGPAPIPDAARAAYKRLLPAGG
jgi:acyl-CoA thioester hydrolase